MDVGGALIVFLCVPKHNNKITTNERKTKTKTIRWKYMMFDMMINKKHVVATMTGVRKYGMERDLEKAGERNGSEREGGRENEGDDNMIFILVCMVLDVMSWREYSRIWNPMRWGQDGDKVMYGPHFLKMFVFMFKHFYIKGFLTDNVLQWYDVSLGGWILMLSIHLKKWPIFEITKKNNQFYNHRRFICLFVVHVCMWK